MSNLLYGSMGNKVFVVPAVYVNRDNMSSDQYTEMIGVRVTEETEEAVERYAEENGLNKSSAARELLREGMWEKRISPYQRSAGQMGNWKGTVIGILIGIILMLLLTQVI